MRTYKHLMAIALIALACSAGIQTGHSQAEEQENFVWITNTNGITEKRVVTRNQHLYFFSDYEKHETAQIVVPEHATSVTSIDMRGCVNLTNLVIQPARAGFYDTNHSTGKGIIFVEKPLVIGAENSGLLNITCSKTMRNSIRLTRGEAEWWPIQWTEPETEPEPAPIEIKTHTTTNGTEVEVIWREGTLQIADAVSGEYRDHFGSSPLRFPLLSAKDMQFYRIGRIEPPTKEEPPTPQTLGGNR